MPHHTRHTSYYSLIDDKPCDTSFDVPIWITRVDNVGIKLVCHNVPIVPYVKSLPTSWDAYILSLDPHVQYILQHSNSNDSSGALALSIQSGKAIAVTDVSVKVTKLTSAIA